MLDYQETPDWNKLSELTAIRYRLFASERWLDLVRTMYNEIVMVPDRDNEELVSVFLDMVDTNAMLKLMFTTWLEGFTERHDGPVTHNEILQFVSYLGICEERHVGRLKAEGLRD